MRGVFRFILRVLNSVPRGAAGLVGVVRRRPRALGASHSDAQPRARIVLVGPGWWAQTRHLPQLTANPGVELVGIVGIRSNEPVVSPNADLKTLDELGEVYRVPTYTSLDEALDCIAEEGAPPIDGAVVSTSHATHLRIAGRALEAGLHVFCEKPMVTCAKDARELQALVARSQRLFMVNCTACWRPNAIRAAGLVGDGRLGDVEHVTIHMGTPLLWLFDDPASPEGWIKASGGMKGNGFGWGQLSHTLSWVYLVTRLTPSRVFAFMGHSKRTGADLYNSATVLCTNGATISISGSATLPGRSPVSSKQIDIKVYGSGGYLSYGGDDHEPKSGSLLLRQHDGVVEEYPGFEFEADSNRTPASLLAFIDGCHGRSVWGGCDVTIGAVTVQTIDAMYESAASGVAVDV